MRGQGRRGADRDRGGRRPVVTIRTLLIIVLFAFVAAACGDPLEGKFGEELYLQTCAHCHGVDLTGGTGPAIGQGSNADDRLTDAQIRDVIKVGPGAMPGYQDRLGDAQIDSLVAYLRLLQRGAGGE